MVPESLAYRSIDAEGRASNGGLLIGRWHWDE
jgi:hypothetical protein